MTDSLRLSDRIICDSLCYSKSQCEAVFFPVSCKINIYVRTKRRDIRRATESFKLSQSHHQGQGRITTSQLAPPLHVRALQILKTNWTNRDTGSDLDISVSDDLLYERFNWLITSITVHYRNYNQSRITIERFWINFENEGSMWYLKDPPSLDFLSRDCTRNHTG